ncbi:hypothetical protein Dimus_008094 [Dionaea muscipula]
MIYVHESHVEKMSKILDVPYEILNVLEFNRLSDGNDDLKKVTRQHLEVTRQHLEKFGSASLRTLCLAYRNLSADMYEFWNEKFILAKSSPRDREKKLDEMIGVVVQMLGYPSQFGCSGDDGMTEGGNVLQH